MNRVRIGAVLTALSLTTMTPPGGPPEPARETPLSRELTALSRRAPITVGHRGAAATHPENTLPSFVAAIEAGAQMVELDFHQTSDGVLVCLHDDTLDRTTDARQVLGKTKVAIAQTESAALAQLDAGSWKHERFADVRVPTLEAALQRIQRDAITMIEHKAGDPEVLVDLLRRTEFVDRVLVQSFDWDWLERVHALEPRITIAALGHEPLTDATLDDVVRTGASMVHWSRRTLRADDVAKLHARGYLICLYTVNDAIGLVGAGVLGIDAIGTDDPAALRALVRDGTVRRGR